ncbi:MAG: peptide deformylase [Deltaproteobacteria bacterium]|nr:peptide deformylase [Deltaproteobacteria bacterium]
MALKKIVIYPDSVLREICEPVEPGEPLSRLLDDLAESMYANKGVGLAAPQIGVTSRVAIIDVDQRDGEPRLIELVNPEILSTADEVVEGDEGCLSFPGEFEKVRRFSRVTVKAMDRNGQAFELTAEGLLARALQHEIDHLDGVLFIDYLSRLKRSMMERRMKKAAKKAASSRS